MTNDRMVRQLLAGLLTNLRGVDIDPIKAQAAISDPVLLASSMAQLINNDCRLTYVNMFSIDLDSPEIPEEGCEFLPVQDQIQSRLKGKWLYDPYKLYDHLVPEQELGGVLRGGDLLQCLEGKPVQRAAFLQFLYRNQCLIPEFWKDDCWHHAFGDVFRGPGGLLYVLYLYWYDGVWYLDWSQLDLEFDARSFAVCVRDFKAA